MVNGISEFMESFINDLDVAYDNFSNGNPTVSDYLIIEQSTILLCCINILKGVTNGK